MAFIHVQSDSPEYGDTAALLVAMANEAGIHPREIQALPLGFLVPSALGDQLAAPAPLAIADPRDEGKTPPPGWGEPLAPADVEFGEDGKVYLTPDAAAVFEDIVVVLDPVEDSLPVLRELALLQADVAEKAPVKPEAAAIRTWARENGFDVPVRGIVPKAVVEAFYEAHSGS